MVVAVLEITPPRTPASSVPERAPISRKALYPERFSPTINTTMNQI
jgi:hypothetical protein